MIAMHERPITPAQLRAGRALLGLSQAELAGRACLSLHTIKQAEAEGETHASEVALAGEGPGVRLRRGGPPDEGLRPDQLTSENDV
jgi:DNA-binding XRE family transcriptional regulator